MNLRQCADGAGVARKGWRTLESGGGANFKTVDAIVRWCAQEERRRREDNPGSRVRYEDFSQVA